jgi:hypothetical protein
LRAVVIPFLFPKHIEELLDVYVKHKTYVARGRSDAWKSLQTKSFWHTKTPEFLTE